MGRRLGQSSQPLAGTTSGYRPSRKSPCHPMDHRRGKRQSQRQCCCRAQFRIPQTVTHEAITSSEKKKLKIPPPSVRPATPTSEASALGDEVPLGFQRRVHFSPLRTCFHRSRLGLRTESRPVHLSQMFIVTPSRIAFDPTKSTCPPALTANSHCVGEAKATT